MPNRPQSADGAAVHISLIFPATYREMNEETVTKDDRHIMVSTFPVWILSNMRHSCHLYYSEWSCGWFSTGRVELDTRGGQMCPLSTVWRTLLMTTSDSFLFCDDIRTSTQQQKCTLNRTHVIWPSYITGVLWGVQGHVEYGVHRAHSAFSSESQLIALTLNSCFLWSNTSTLYFMSWLIYLLSFEVIQHAQLHKSDRITKSSFWPAGSQ